MASVCATGSTSLRGAATSLAAHNSGLSQASALTRSHSEAGCSTSSKIGGLPCRTMVIDHPISSQGRSTISKASEGGKPRTNGQGQQCPRVQAPVVYTCRHVVNDWSVVGLMTRRRRSSAASLRRALGAPPADCVSARRGRGRSSRVCLARAEASATSASAGASAPCAAVRQSAAQVADSASSPSNRAETAEAHSRTAAQAGASLRTVVRSLDPSTGEDSWRPLRVLVVGAGIGGLVFALAAKKKGIDVQVFERDTSAIRGEGQYRGPIQIQSNALAALEAIDQEVAEKVMHEGTVTGDRVNGLVDGLTGEWYIKFDTWNPAVRKGLPVTRVISRMMLQEILSEAVGSDIVQGSSTVVDYEDDGEKVVAILDDGRRVEGDLLVGADGIRSKVRAKLLGPTEATYSDYTCYTGIADFVPIDIDTVGYRVFLGSKQYFVSSDVGHGKMQWYAFHYQEAGQEDPPGPRKERLLNMFSNWCDEVVELLLATPEEMILRRDIYDRIPIVNWSKGRVTLLGDSAHAMQPNMGQGGCMAIEDAYELALDIDKAVEEVEKRKEDRLDVAKVLKQYENARRLRVAAIHGMARMAAIMASTYITFLGGGLSLSWLMKLRIPHPGRVFGKIFMSPTMPLMLDWVLGGYSTNLENRAPYCRIEDKATYNFDEYLKDDELLYKTTTADWTLMRVTDIAWWKSLQEGHKREQWKISDRSGEPVIVGSSPATLARGTAVAIDLPVIAKHHAKFTMRNGLVFMEDLPESTGTLLNGATLRPGSPFQIRPGDIIEMGGENQEKVKLRVRLEKSSNEKSSKVLVA